MPRRRDQELLRRVGQRVAHARGDRGWSQERLAEAVGIEPVSLSRLETGDRALSLSTLAAIADALGVNVGDLIDEGRLIPAPQLGPEAAELVRSFEVMPRSRQRLLLKLARELAN